jgi:hypothetical protein
MAFDMFADNKPIHGHEIEGSIELELVETIGKTSLWQPNPGESEAQRVAENFHGRKRPRVEAT